MAQAMPINERDLPYERLCNNLSDGRMTMGGDSHGQRISDRMWEQLGRLSYRGGQAALLPWNRGGPRLLTDGVSFTNFVKGGMKASSYATHPKFIDLKLSEANIAIIAVGGNDLDDNAMSGRQTCRQVLSDIFWIVRQLQDLGKQAYVVELPSRFSTRRKNLAQYQREVRYVNKRLQNQLDNRLITLRGGFFGIGAFEEWNHVLDGVQVTEFVHLRPENYALLASDILTWVLNDLTLVRSRPSTIRPYINLNN